MIPQHHQAAHRLDVAHDFQLAVQASDFDRADQLLPELGGMLPDGVLLNVAQLHMHRERWAEAVTALHLVQSRDASTQLHLNLCKNLAALKEHRPEIYRTVAAADVGQAYQLAPTQSGTPTIQATRPNGTMVLLSGGGDPLQSVKHVRAAIEQAMVACHPLALLSIGDGYVLKEIAADKRTYFMDRQQAIFVFEPDARLVFATMLLHDFTGPTGPIEQKRVHWYVGTNWLGAYRVDALTDRYLPFPITTLKLGIEPATIESGILGVLKDINALEQRAGQEIQRYYAEKSAEDFRKAISQDLPRAPRALLLTTRFSTVLQHSTRDAAEGLRELEWETLTLIEPSPSHVLSRSAIRRAIAEFKPDLIFQIDHNRFEHGDLMPANVPFVNWIQDLLPHLMTPATGAKLGTRDYVLTPSLQRWVDDFAYPRRQCMEFRKLTHVGPRPESWSSDSQRVVYVSNWSQTPQQMHAELIRNEQGKSREVMDLACQRMIACYEAEQALPTMGDVRRLLIDVMRDLEVAASEPVIRKTATVLFDRLNNLLYRQQGLRWAVSACTRLKLGLEIYGTGWENHPEFKAFSRGKIGYGEELEELTREVGINLVLEPFVCIAHQRLLDSLACGGFCLIRDHPAHLMIPATLELLYKAGNDVTNEKRLRAALTAADVKKLDQIMDYFNRADLSPGAIDQVALVSDLARNGFIPTQGWLVPMLDQNTFSGSADMERKIHSLSLDAKRREQIASAQRKMVEDRYSYATGLRRMAEFVCSALATELPAQRSQSRSAA